MNDLLVLSDLHLNHQTTQRTELFLKFLQTAASNNDEVVIAGDLFDLWLGFPRLTFPFQQSIIDRMKLLAQNGLPIHYVEGNRDFGIEHRHPEIFRTVSKSGFRTQWGGRTLKIIHGDMINRNDTLYRIWRTATKNPISMFFLSKFPRSIVLKLAASLERELKASNKKFKSVYPEEESIRYFHEESQQGTDILVTGHFHTEREQEMQIHGRNVLFYNLPGWEQGFRYLVIPGGGGKPFFAQLGRENGDLTTSSR